jgi:hypothetical protein
MSSVDPTFNYNDSPTFRKKDYKTLLILSKSNLTPTTQFEVVSTMDYADEAL